MFKFSLGITYDSDVLLLSHIYRTYATPPAMVTHVMSAVCVLLGHATDWDTVKFITKNATVFIKRLTTFDKDNVPDKVWCLPVHMFRNR